MGRRAIMVGLGICAAAALAATPRDAAGQLARRQPPTVWTPPQPEAPRLPLAVGGYCPVMLRDHQQWVAGAGAWGVQFDGRQYLLADERRRDIFLASPGAYAPVLGGDCPVTFAETGQRVAGRVEFGVVQAGRIWFFASDETRARFVSDPARYADADLIDGGRCIVSRVEHRRDVAGLPQTAVLIGGQRRLFAGAHEQALFLRQPERYDAGAAELVATGAAARPGGDGWRSAGATPAPGGSSAPNDGADVGAEMTSAAPSLGGFCPVTLRDKGAWLRGRFEERVEIDGRIFFTAGAAEREALLADPARYMPVLGGDCPVSLVDFGQQAPGSAYHAADYQGRIFLMADADAKAAFKAQPERYARADLAADGLCVVTLRETGERRPGMAEASVWYDGLLYRLAGPEERAKFLADPEEFAVERVP